MGRIICSIGNGEDWCGHESDGIDDSLPLCSRHRKLINELLREQIARGIEAISDYQVLETTNRKGFESQMEVTDAVKKLAIAIARGDKK